ncbi:MAG: sigma 54-interacting transcriptional regulator [Fibrobacter sp.]|jgi:Nif-specific regulatory protein|uniref:sigma-54 interaction domain-containing protein n=1 Tax=Fibrobacter sp. UWP2 TaxID=1896216 RepID=UPI0009194602|nr:sigma 54-interacting transcriptional regulator [Fibrobacter sp. UWP2]MBO7384252.1 sigma 54-interacting transcriptional regulator [Fibrobacter sp.]SHJ18732.1 Nif-specific regulatory protein [Fibrobacter sp. UWP2]
MSQTIAPEISVIQKISEVIIHERNVEKLLKNVLGILDSEMGMLRGTFALLYGDTLKIEASHGLGENEKQLGQYRVGEGITGHVAETGRSHVIPDLRKDSRFLNRTGARNYNSQVAFICVPLIHEEKVIGTLSIDRPVDGTTQLDRDVALLEIIANITGDAANECIEIHDEREALMEENRKLRDMLNVNHTEIVGKCSEMQMVYEQIQQVAPSDATVLIRGASGTGKEMVARAIVNLSQRKDRPFVTLNCAALPENLVESELFGHEKGAFTGAVNRRIGRAEAANGGTLFLDEIGDLSLPVQVKLLRFLQEKTFSRVGSNEELHSDVRFLAATSRNLEELMEKKLFREDLFYRLNIFPISVPDLAKRHTDIILLAEHFMEKMNLRYNKKVVRLSTIAINMLMSYHWPGNVRELENCIERAVLTAKDDCIHSYNLPPSLQTSYSTGASGEPNSERNTLSVLMDNYEREIFTEAIKRSEGNLSAAGRELGISPRMMNYRMNKLGLNSKK